VPHALLKNTGYTNKVILDTPYGIRDTFFQLTFFIEICRSGTWTPFYHFDKTWRTPEYRSIGCETKFDTL